MSRKTQDPALMLKPAFKGQVVSAIKVEGSPYKLQTQITTGLIAQCYDVNASYIESFPSRFASLYEEYRIIKMQWKIKFFSSTCPGVLITWVDEKKLSTLPTLSEAKTKVSSRNIVNLSRVGDDLMITWVPRDPLDQQYIASNSYVNVCAFKAYTDYTNFGAPIAVTDVGIVYPTYTLQFRGLV